MAEEREQPISAPERLDELQLVRFMEGRLDAAEQADVQARLQRSPEDRRTLDALREEARLLREATENLSEPPAKIGEKVIAVLRAEHRRQVALERARRFRNRLIALTATAALLLLGLYFLSPREETARMLSGTAASVARDGGTPVPLPKGGLLYDEDTLITGRAQFVRVGLTSNCRVDVDEDSRLRIEKGAASLFSIESGRARVSTVGLKHSALVRTSYGHIRAEPDTEFEFWLATPREIRWPAWTEAWRPERPEVPPPTALACVTVFRGSVYIHTDEHPKGFPVGAGRRVTFTAGRLPVSQQEFDDWEALDSRREPWHGLDGVAPPGLASLELFPPFNWKELGERMGLLGDRVTLPASVVAATKEAFGLLAKAQSVDDPVARAAQLGQGQQALRAAAQGLPLSSELRWLGRTIEGLAHYERGRCLQGRSPVDATGAFLAASVAFHEALAGSQQDLGADAGVAAGLGSYAAPKLTVSARLKDLSPVEQGMLLARFYLPWALLAQADQAGKAGETETMAREPLPPLFEQAAALLDVSVEGLAARYGRALALAAEGRADEALEVLAGIRSFSVAGLPDPVRAQAEGLRQAAHVASVRIHAGRDEWDRVHDVLDLFRTRYPLSKNGPAMERMEAIQAQALRQAADAAYEKKDWTTAWSRYDALLRASEAETRLTPAAYWALRLRQLEIALAAGKGVEALRLARQIKHDGAAGLSAANRTRAAELGAQAEELFRSQRQERKTRAVESIQLDMRE